ncbi:hypothetical protein FBU59_001867 [Linderina macrospora]|uniref:Uncharacterized protein n=1 Tax=Linderina macrospora TaxID=4868 RepID=A0ACC1JCX0_9FUNG|nr:hypothetical protein FBU59_001867 [Linderina macrospora]
MAAESMDVDSPGSLFGSSPDQQLATHHNNYRLFESSSLQGRNTGLEMKMQGFSLRDDDEDVDMEPAAATSSSRHFLVPDSTREMAGKGGELMWTNPLTIGRRVVFVASVLLLLLCLAKGPHHAPAWGARVLFVLSLAKPPGQQPTRAARFWWHRVLLLLLSAALLMLPAVYTALSIKSMPLGSMTGALLRWPHAKSFVIRAIEYAVFGSDTPLELAVPNANDQMLRRVMAGDFVAEFAALVYFCVWP